MQTASFNMQRLCICIYIYFTHVFLRFFSTFLSAQRKSNAFLDVPAMHHLRVSDDDEDLDRLRTFSASKGGEWMHRYNLSTYIQTEYKYIYISKSKNRVTFHIKMALMMSPWQTYSVSVQHLSQKKLYIYMYVYTNWFTTVIKYCFAFTAITTIT